MITLIIKGDMMAANAALELHQIVPFTIEPHQKFREVIIRVHVSTPWEKLAKWFCEKPIGKQGAPFPDGTLLWYGPAYEGPKVANFYEPDMSAPVPPAPQGWDKVEGGPKGTSLDMTYRADTCRHGYPNTVRCSRCGE